jgi:CheY-like chemotaxis protein/cytidylate kinase
MSIIALFCGTHCGAEETAAMLAEKLGLPLIDEERIFGEALDAGARSPLDAGGGAPIDAEGRRPIDAGARSPKLRRALYRKPSVFNDFTHERERAIACVRMALAERLKQDGFIINGFSAHLVPRGVTHMLKVCLIADIDRRAELAAAKNKISAKAALHEIQEYDNGLNLWTQYLFGKKPWDHTLYDILVPMDKTSAPEAVALISEAAAAAAVRADARSLKAVGDFHLASEVNLAIAKKGHDVRVECEDGVVTAIIDKYTFRLSHLEEELKAIAAAVPGVGAVQTRVGPDFNKGGYYRRFDDEMPRVLLVDDEKDFVTTLSKRIQMRDVGSAVVYDGREALTFVNEESPDVMVLDLKMPDIDGIEVLRKIKTDHPGIEVIMLTGHGSEKTRQEAEALGVYAYMSKPVDVETLVSVMKNAHKKIIAARGMQPPA